MNGDRSGWVWVTSQSDHVRFLLFAASCDKCVEQPTGTIELLVELGRPTEEMQMLA